MKKVIKAVLTAALVMVITVPAAAKTTVSVDYIGDKVLVKTSATSKTLKYKIKTVYVAKDTRLYTEPKKGRKSKIRIKKGDPITRIAKGKTFSVVRYDKGKRRYWFVKNSQLVTKKPVKMNKKSVKAKYSASYFRKMGVIRWNGYRWTWYSQRVLPGGGLKIPGRHVDEHGYICDKDDYICVASSTLKKGTVINTPFGKDGKVYDCGCSAGTIDVYVDRLH